MSHDTQTIAFYDGEAAVYAEFAEGTADRPYLLKFMSLLPSGGHVLDLGAGPGWGAGLMQREGFTVLAQDASAGLLAEAARRHAIPTRCAPFEALSEAETYDGIWASFSLLHTPRDAMPGNLDRCCTALKPGGLLYLGLRAGEGETRDGKGRFYTFYGADELAALLAAAGFVSIDTRLRKAGPGYDGSETTALHAFARRPR